MCGRHLLQTESFGVLRIFAADEMEQLQYYGRICETASRRERACISPTQHVPLVDTISRQRGRSGMWVARSKVIEPCILHANKKEKKARQGNVMQPLPVPLSPSGKSVHGSLKYTPCTNP